MRFKEVVTNHNQRQLINFYSVSRILDINGYAIIIMNSGGQINTALPYDEAIELVEHLQNV